MIRNQIQTAKVIGYKDGYAVVTLHASGDAEPIEEVMPLRTNTASQALPEVGADVLVAADNNGDLYLLGAIASDNQPLPSPSGEKEIVSDNGSISITQTAQGQIEIKNQSQELIDLLVSTLDLLLSATTTIPPGGGTMNLSIALPPGLSALDALKLRLETFKV
jgi:phage baseplate assembly protein gpV